ncbi:cytochrome c oxidase cbb3-type subunit 4 [Oxalobacteraceae bacterium GrIS 1.11]
MANLFDSASSVMTVISFITFGGILWWTFITRSSSDFDAVANLPFADDDGVTDGESRHV